MERLKFREKNYLLMIPNIQAPLKHSGGNVMAWAFIASSRTGSIIFINDVTHEGSSKINSKLKLTCSKIMTQNIIPKQRRSSSGQEVEGFRLVKSISTLKPCRVCNLPSKEETEGSNPPQLKEAAVKAWKSITKEECKSLVMSMGHRIDAVVESKGFATKYKVIFTLIYVNSICSNTFAHMKNGSVQTKGAIFQVVYQIQI